MFLPVRKLRLIESNRLVLLGFFEGDFKFFSERLIRKQIVFDLVFILFVVVELFVTKIETFLLIVFLFIVCESCLLDFFNSGRFLEFTFVMRVPLFVLFWWSLVIFEGIGCEVRGNFAHYFYTIDQYLCTCVHILWFYGEDRNRLRLVILRVGLGEVLAYGRSGRLLVCETLIKFVAHLAEHGFEICFHCVLVININSNLNYNHFIFCWGCLRLRDLGFRWARLRSLFCC